MLRCHKDVFYLLQDTLLTLTRRPAKAICGAQKNVSGNASTMSREEFAYRGCPGFARQFFAIRLSREETNP
jgi:hypothetical protein